MTLVVDKFRTLLPPRAKQSPSGWTSFNAPCCQHRGHSPDTRKRGGIRFDGNSVVYNCFNCKFSTGWQPGSPFGEKMKTLSRWLGAGEDLIKELVFEALKTESEDYQPDQIQLKVDFEDKELPEGAMPLFEWIKIEQEGLDELLAPIITYITNRGFDPLDNNFWWSPASGYENRLIIPFLWEGRIVGNTARKVTEGKPKYLSDQHPHFVFNFDKQKEDQKYILVCEGPFDALSIGGVALLTNDIADQQARIINSLGAEVIVIPDQDHAGSQLVDRAIELGWSVSLPTWEEGVKDVAEAVQKYGRLFVIVDAIETSVSGQIKGAILKNHMLQKINRNN